MAIKNEVLRKLEENRGTCFSGESLADALGVSRAAVWKAVDALRKEGYPIEAGTNKGYLLEENSDLLSEQGIRLHLEESNRSIEIHVFKSIDSTNLEAKRLAVAGAPHGTLIISNEQSQGRGRLSRGFFSPASSGVYMSILLKPNFDISKAVLMTTAASVAVARAIKKICDIETQIKWVNDVYAGNHKICGILTEAITDFESGAIEYVALGIGINCKEPEYGFPEDIAAKAGTLAAAASTTAPEPTLLTFPRNALAAEVVNQFLSIYDQIDDRRFLNEYKERSLVLGKEIKVFKHFAGQQPTELALGASALALDIDQDGGLLVEYEDGRREILNTGEISIGF